MSIEWPAHGLKLQARIESGTAQIGVIGMGYVGLPLAVAFCEANCSVLAFDLDQDKIDALHAGRSYIKHIDGARIAPRFQIMGGRDLDARGSRSLVDVVAVANDLGQGLLQRRPIQVDGRIVNRVAAQHDESLDAAGLDGGGEVLEAARRHRLSRDKVNRVAHVAEIIVQQVGNRMHHRRLVRACDDKALATMGPQIVGARFEPLVFPREIEAGRMAGQSARAQNRIGQGRGKRRHMAARQP